MFWPQLSLQALVLVFAILFCHRATAEVPVNLADADPLKDCNRRDVKCRQRCRASDRAMLICFPVIETGNKVYMYGKFAPSPSTELSLLPPVP